MNSQIGNRDPLSDDTVKGWNLSWKPEGYSNQFTKQAILACAPAASGVYGLFNFDCQIFIGAADNIQEVLLRLQEQVDFQSQHLQPTGFTFELCPEELRGQRASELIARYRPALQSLADLCAPSQVAIAEGITEPDSAKDGGQQDLTAVADVTGHRPLFRVSRLGYLVVLLLCGIVGAYYALRPADRIPAVQSQVGSSEMQQFQAPASVQAPRINHAGAPLSEGKPAKLVHPPDEMAKNAVRLVKSVNTDESEIEIRPATSSGRDKAETRWSVQVAAVPARDVAERLAKELTQKGYDGYVISAEVKGQTYYRVRAGRFSAREHAESARQSLAGQESYREAYVTGD